MTSRYWHHVTLASLTVLPPVIKVWVTTIDLFHSSYSYTPDAECLTAVYSNFLDFGEGFPPFGAFGEVAVIAQMLTFVRRTRSCAPVSAIFSLHSRHTASSPADGHSWPELYHLGKVRSPEMDGELLTCARAMSADLSMLALLCPASGSRGEHRFLSVIGDLIVQHHALLNTVGVGAYATIPHRYTGFVVTLPQMNVQEVIPW